MKSNFHDIIYLLHLLSWVVFFLLFRGSTKAFGIREYKDPVFTRSKYFIEPEIIRLEGYTRCKQLLNSPKVSVSQDRTSEKVDFKNILKTWCRCMIYDDTKLSSCEDDPCMISICDERSTRCLKSSTGYTCHCRESYSNIENGVCQLRTYTSAESIPCVLSTTRITKRDDGFICECREGYERYSPFECVEMKKCSETGHFCEKESTTCKDNGDSFNCECNIGYTRKNHLFSCNDINECQSKSICGKTPSLCFNEKGGFVCRSLDGSWRRKSLRDSRDINPCTIKEINPCNIAREREEAEGLYPLSIVAGENCIYMSRGRHKCVCAEGFKNVNGLSCQDIDECKEGIHRCHPTTECLNTRGSYECRCKPGYKIADAAKQPSDPRQTVCVDINECEEKVLTPNNVLVAACDPISSVCVNTPGSYECKCFAGYRDQSTFRKKKYGCSVSMCCVDIDECKENLHQCSDLCESGIVLPPLNYSCGCPDGRYLVNSRRCDDCEYTDFSSLGPCNATCGWGYRNKTREVVKGLGDTSPSCLRENLLQSFVPCLGVNCASAEAQCILTPWSDWSDCALSGDKPIQTQSRQIIMGNPNCETNLIRTRECKLKSQVTLEFSWGEVIMVAVLFIFITLCIIMCIRGYILRRNQDYTL